MTDHVAHLVIRGRVQGVGFRAWVHHHAELNGLAGWVRNRKDGSVEAVLCGPDHLVEAMVKACRQGPGGSEVQSVEVQPGDGGRSPGAPGSFEVLPNA